MLLKIPCQRDTENGVGHGRHDKQVLSLEGRLKVVTVTCPHRPVCLSTRSIAGGAVWKNVWAGGRGARSGNKLLGACLIVKSSS